MSSIGWVDFSEEERQRTLGVLRLLDEPGTLDALGIGRIRDAFSDLLFPGTSTIQTRARYFLIVPWIYRDLERRSPRRDPGGEASRRERKLIDEYNAAREDGDGDLDGLIGSQAGSSIRQLPSDIYWQGMQAWGIRRKSGPKRAFLGEARRGRIRKTSGPETEMELVSSSWWDSNLPPEPDDLFDNPTLGLGPVEAEYLREAIAVNQSASLLNHLVRQEESLPEVNLFWELPAGVLGQVPDGLARDLYHARRFSLMVHGAHILYYLMMAELKPGEETQADRFRSALADWQETVIARTDELQDWFGSEEGRGRFWQTVKKTNPSVPSAQERSFLEGWFDLALSKTDRGIDSQPARELLINRELALKGRQRAKLSSVSAREYATVPSQVSPLDFRWGTVKRHLEDIHAGLNLPSGAGARA